MSAMNTVKEWAAEAFKNDFHYIIGVFDSTEEEEQPIYCKTFEDFHAKYHEYYDKEGYKINNLIQVYHDGTYDEHIKINNLL